MIEKKQSPLIQPFVDGGKRKILGDGAQLPKKI